MGLRKWIADEFDAVREHVETKSHRWIIDRRDRAKIYWAAVWGGLATASVEMAGFVRDYVVPSIQQDGGVKAIVIGMLATGAAHFVIALARGPERAEVDPPAPPPKQFPRWS